MAYRTTIAGSPTQGPDFNPWLNSLVWGVAWADLPEVVNVRINYFTQSGSDLYGVHSGGKKWASSETKALESAMASWEAVAKIDFVKTSNPANADVWYWLNGDGDFLGWHEVPDPNYFPEEPLYGVFNPYSSVWSNTNNLKGGYSYATFIHELGHGLGLAHPHDGGDAIDAIVFPGVTGPFNSYGDFYLNQGIWTTMSYNDGWAFTANGQSLAMSSSYAYGWQATPMALDIAAIQLIYGANMNYATGNNTYTLPTSNKSGTYWSCIWDAGGNDTIAASTSTSACTINLNEATLIDENAGGFVSRVSNIYGGFTIANGAIIENAIGGKAADTLIGNSYNNTLTGNQGNDILDGGVGNDILIGGTGADELHGGDGIDYFKIVAITESGLTLSTQDTIDDFLAGTDKIDLSTIDAKYKFTKNDSFVFLGNSAPTDTITSNGALWYELNDGTTIVYASNDRDIAPELAITLIGEIALSATDFFL